MPGLKRPTVLNGTIPFWCFVTRSAQISRKLPRISGVPLNTNKPAFIHFDEIGYDLDLKPGEVIHIDGKTKNPGAALKVYFDFYLKTKGEEKSYVIRRQINASDSLEVPSGKNWAEFGKTIKVPSFSGDSFAVTPIVRLVSEQPLPEETVFVRDVRLSVPESEHRLELFRRIEAYIKQQGEHNALRIPDPLSWTNQNFVMGFAFIWDTDFWDPVNGKYTVDAFCRNREKAFGGLQSVVIWHSYPNLGIDEKNQFDFFRAMPGGLDGLKNVVADFHRNHVRVFLTYNPWDLDTHRPAKNDFKELASVLTYCNADGIYLDTWKSSKGVISVFDTQNSIRDEVSKLGKSVAFTTEILPQFKDLVGKDALTSSWGQDIHPFHYTDLSMIKWIMPSHKQYFISRMAKDRKRMMAHAWINGQGIQVWEDIFGTMNPWNAKDRKALRKMNAVWQAYGDLYLTDNWQPFISVNNPEVVASSWMSNGLTIYNFVDTTLNESRVTLEVPDNDNLKYFDIWNGISLTPVRDQNKYYINLTIKDFSCVIATKDEPEKLTALLDKQRKETAAPLPALDEHVMELSLKDPLTFDYGLRKNDGFHPALLHVKGGIDTFICEHIWREGECYPNENAANNHELVTRFENGALRIIHTDYENLEDFSIMPRIVTNGEFEQFLKATGYKPRFPENFLNHWHGSTCPPEMKNDPVVYVSLEDARAFAQWAGMQLPTEWEWQAAAEQYRDKFIFNEVFEWNESERYDGHNRFVTLRGGCSRWTLPSSWWYFPGAPAGTINGGARKDDSHVKYFLMYPGLDRASTLGFRVMKNRE